MGFSCGKEPPRNHQAAVLTGFTLEASNALFIVGDVGTHGLYSAGPDASDAATDLLEAITPAMKAWWIASEPRDWANESFAISEAVRTGYCVRHEASCSPPGGDMTVSGEYLDANAPIVREQLQKAGVRLARLLDIAFGN